MTPNRRLNQLEPLMADALQKIDRLIEGQGQIVEIAIGADSKAEAAATNAEAAATNAEIAAKGIANLTITVQRGFTDINQQFVRVEQGFDTIRTDIDDLKAGQVRLETNQQEILTLLRKHLS